MRLEWTRLKRFIYVLFAVLFVCFLFFIGCSDDSEPIFTITFARHHVMYPNEPRIWTVPTYPSPNRSHYFDAFIAGRYRVAFCCSYRELLYAEFTIFDGDEDASN